MYKYYCYRHVRLDKNVPFYIGIGKVRSRNIKSISHNYDRAFSKRNRNPIWKNIVSKTEYLVEILFESNCEKEIRDKEIEFIKLYGFRNEKGTLCNMTSGGEGIRNYKFTEIQLKKMSEIQTEIANRPEKIEYRRNLCKGNSYMKGKKHTEESKKLMSDKAKLRPVNSKSYKCKLIDLETNEVWESESLMSLAKICPVSISTIDRMAQGRKISNKFNNKYKLEKL